MWYVIAGVVMLAISLYSFIVGQFMLGVVLMIFCWAYLVFEINAREKSVVSIWEEGIVLDDQMYEMVKIQQFGVIYVHNKPEILRIILNQKISPLIDIDLPDDISVPRLREFLGGHVVENEDMELSVVQHLLHVFHV